MALHHTLVAATQRELALADVTHAAYRFTVRSAGVVLVAPLDDLRRQRGMSLIINHESTQEGCRVPCCSVWVSLPLILVCPFECIMCTSLFGPHVVHHISPIPSRVRRPSSPARMMYLAGEDAIANTNV